MTIRQTLEALAAELNTPCVTISLNTHRTHPDNAQDIILLKNLINEAEERLISEFGKRDVAPLLEKLSSIEVDVNYNLDSLHIYLSNDTEEIIRSPWAVEQNKVAISDSFDVRPLIKTLNRSEEYLILLLSQSGVHLYEALNDEITHEMQNDDFPFSENSHFIIESEKRSDSKSMDNMVREFLNKLDQAVVNVHNETGLHCVVICTEDNYSRLMQVADNPAIYIGHANIDYNNTPAHQLAKQSWVIVEERQQIKRAEAIEEMKEAVAHGNVLTSLQDIYQASIDGRGDLLIVHQDFSQPVVMTSDRTFELVTETGNDNVIDDITSNIAWNVMAKKGQVIFTSQDEIKDLGEIVLKTRY